MKVLRFVLLAGVSSAAVIEAGSSAPALVDLGLLLDSPFTYMFSLSDDGNAASGHSGGDVSLWTRSAGLEAIDMLPNASFGYGFGLSGDGTTMVGYDLERSGNHRAFRWSATEGVSQLESLPSGTGTYAWGVSRDGAVIVGSNLAQGGLHAVRWTAPEGVTVLGNIPGYLGGEALDVSGDGRTIVGVNRNIDTEQRAFRWTAESGTRGLELLSGEQGESRANGISGDGRVIVGFSDSLEGRRAVRWVDGTAEDLGMVDGFSLAGAVNANQDGSVVVGALREGNLRHAFYWSESLGMVDLNEYLPSLGVDLTGWVLTSAEDVSADGQTILGLGLFAGNTRSWVVTIPSPSAVGLMAFAGIACARRRR